MTTDEEWFAAMFKAMPDAGLEACLTLWGEAVEKYLSGELAEVGSVKLFDLIQARMEALEGVPQDAAEPAEVTLPVVAPAPVLTRVRDRRCPPARGTAWRAGSLSGSDVSSAALRRVPPETNRKRPGERCH